MNIKNAYDLEQMVYLKTDDKQRERQITAITVKPGNHLVYELTYGTQCGDHLECEIRPDRDVLKALKADNEEED